MIRQIGLLLLATVILAFGGSTAVGTLIFKRSMESQWRARNGDAATLLALAMSQQAGDRQMMELVLSAQFDAGHYRRIRLVGVDGKVVFEREGPEKVGSAPGWFISALPLKAPPGLASVSDGWRQIGQLQVESHGAWAYNALWDGMLQFMAFLTAIGVAALAGASVAVRGWRRTLDLMVGQAKGVEEARFQEIPEPTTLELRQLASGMNSMVRRVRTLFENQASQLDGMRKQLQRDPVSGTANRATFLALLQRALGASSQASSLVRRGCLIMVRLPELNAINRRVGRNLADKLLVSLGQVLQGFADRAEGGLAGRLNGADFALYLPVNHIAERTAGDVLAALRPLFEQTDPESFCYIGALEGLGTGAVGQTLSRIDAALAQAESNGPFSIEVRAGSEGEEIGEGEWRRRVTSALEREGAARLAQFPVVDASGTTLYLECPLRLQLVPDGPYMSSAHWLPMAIRAHLVQRADLMATRMVLQAIEADGQARAVYMAAASLADSPFVQAVTALLSASPQAARKLFIEASEAPGAIEQAWPGAAALWRPLGVRMGLGNARESLQTLLDAKGRGLDFLKVDGRFLRGISKDPKLAEYAGQVAAAARSIGVTLYAEGIDQVDDLPVLWQLGYDGATGPAVRKPG